MKKFQSTIGVLLLIDLTLSFVNCTKNEPEPTSPTLNYSTFTDSRDGKTYKYIKIGTQEWMAENLTFKTANGSWNYNDSEENAAIYGRLYNWEAAKQAVPAGWHLPSDAEWKQLEITLGMDQTEADGVDARGTNEGDKLKTTSGWAGPENNTTGNGIDIVGFSALPGGTRLNSGNYIVSRYHGYWWTDTENNSVYGYFRMIKYNSSKVYRNISFKEDAFSVRCIKD